LDELDPDEVFVLILGLACAVVAVFRLSNALGATHLVRNGRSRLILAVAPLLGLFALHVVIARWAARDVRESATYLALFDTVGLVWLVFVWLVMPLTGLSPRDDALETNNPAAVIAVCGAWFGALACYAGGNIGEGPTIWTTIGPAALATVIWLGLWVALELVARAGEAIAIDRDPASGWRLGSLLAANGILLGAGAAGDYVSLADTVRSVRSGACAAVAATAAAAIAQRWWRPTPGHPVRTALREGVLPGAALLLLAIVWVALGGVR
jgi:hypothetical protein